MNLKKLFSIILVFSLFGCASIDEMNKNILYLNGMNIDKAISMLEIGQPTNYIELENSKIYIWESLQDISVPIGGYNQGSGYGPDGTVVSVSTWDPNKSSTNLSFRCKITIYTTNKYKITNSLVEGDSAQCNVFDKQLEEAAQHIVAVKRILSNGSIKMVVNNREQEQAAAEIEEGQQRDVEIGFIGGYLAEKKRIIMYQSLGGVPENDAEAVKWYRKAADQGDVNAQFNLGVMYEKGYVVPENDAEAVKWYRKAADQGDASAQFSLGAMYDYGEGVPENGAEAVKWYRKAADQGHASAQFSLGAMYDYGEGVPENDAEAVKWYRKAADQGHVDAQSSLGYMRTLHK